MAPIGKVYMYKGHSRLTRLEAVAAAAGVEYELVITTPPDGHKDPEFMAKFPTWTVPAFESADGKTTLTEAAAISMYICTVAAPDCGLVPEDPALRAQIVNWLLICEGEIMTPLAVCHRAHVGMYNFDEEMAKGALGAVERRIGRIDNWVKTHPYVVGDKLSLADITLASVLGHGYNKFFDKTWQEKFPNALAYFQRIIAEPKLKGAFGEPNYNEAVPPPVKK